MSNMDVLSWMCQPSVLRSMIGHNIKVGLNEFEGRLGGDKDVYQDILRSGLIICTHVSVSRTQNLLNPATFESTREAQLTQNFKFLRVQRLDSSLLTPNLQTIPKPAPQTSNQKSSKPESRIPDPKTSNLETQTANRQTDNPTTQNPAFFFSGVQRQIKEEVEPPPESMLTSRRTSPCRPRRGGLREKRCLSW
jgi:hypothetical protein